MICKLRNYDHHQELLIQKELTNYRNYLVCHMIIRSNYSIMCIGRPYFMTFRFKYSDLHFWTGRIRFEVVTMRGPESVLITGSPYKVIIRALQLVLHYVLVSIG